MNLYRRIVRRALSVCALAATCALTTSCVGRLDSLDPGVVADATDAAVELGDPVDAAPYAPDAAPSAPDAASQFAYPPGPYGVNQGDVIANLSWTGYMDTDADADDDPFNEPAHEIPLESYFSGSDPSATVILITSSAGWCGACQDEASSLATLNEEYRAKGARFLTAMFEDAAGSPATESYAKTWGQTFGLGFATVADPNDLVGPYYVQSSMPMNMFVDATTMTIIDVHHGFSYSYTRQVLDANTN